MARMFDIDPWEKRYGTLWRRLSRRWALGGVLMHRRPEKSWACLANSGEEQTRHHFRFTSFVKYDIAKFIALRAEWHIIFSLHSDS
jgi:hypothetical protein